MTHKRILMACLLLPFVVANGFAQTIQVDRIDADEVISGTVSGLSQVEDYKVIVYAKTDQWYIHPFAGQGEGLSWASIAADGKWRIRTVRREFKANKIAALVVKRAYPEPATTNNLAEIPAKAQTIKELKPGDEDYGKL